MTEILQKYKQTVRLDHGWEVELTCPECNWNGIPPDNGWTPGLEIHFGNTPTIYSNLKCPECECNLRKEAGEKLVEMFSDVELDRRNKRYLAFFILFMIGVPVIIFAVVYAGIQAGLWGKTAYAAFTLMAVLLAPAILYFNYKIGMISSHCECGSGYRFMGLLGRCYCFRCSSCGHLLKTRD